ncbi:hypothetical protein FOXB_02624 [Fusarium oxysporum f. sp. conglutinans Fo5176]|uniref:Uncharacterized protein n=1 Tax=Fusarium oxysporum (strain Fo5176) TaxID=660025 RepID=F9F899_FUSOF|nr:hypothetical protein FOXB_02624 [Fusarium oxysporum f. sp. conglutinans Fo5176]
MGNMYGRGIYEISKLTYVRVLRCDESLESLTCSLAGPNLLPVTYFKGHSFADPCGTLKSSTALPQLALFSYKGSRLKLKAA